MSNFKQEYNLSEMQNNNENKQVGSFIRWWAVCVFVCVGIVAYYIAMIETMVVPIPPDIVLWVMGIIAALAAVAQHVIAIVGKINYRKHNAINTVFAIDMVMLGITVILLIALALLIKACNECG